LQFIQIASRQTSGRYAYFRKIIVSRQGTRAR